jgi:hypothetical protein
MLWAGTHYLQETQHQRKTKIMTTSVSTQGKVNITRPSLPSGDDLIYLQIKDVASGKPIVSITMTPHDFAMALTGMSMQPCFYGVDNPQFIGKFKAVRHWRAELTITELDTVLYAADYKDCIKDYMYANIPNKDWAFTGYLNSQNSVVSNLDGKIIVNAHVERFFATREEAENAVFP